MMATFFDCPQAQRQHIVNEVRGAIATFGGPELSGDDIADLVRWTVDAYLASPHQANLYELARERAYEAGYGDGIASAQAEAKVKAG